MFAIARVCHPGVSCRATVLARGILARMTQTDHRAAALAALDAARIARETVADEFSKPTGRRDYNLIGELRAAARNNLMEAQVHALLATTDTPRVVITVNSTHDAQGALRRLRLDRLEAEQTHATAPDRWACDSEDAARVDGPGTDIPTC